MRIFEESNEFEVKCGKIRISANERFENREIKPKSVLVEKRRDLDCSSKISKKRYDIVTISISKTTIFSN